MMIKQGALMLGLLSCFALACGDQSSEEQATREGCADAVDGERDPGLTCSALSGYAPRSVCPCDLSNGCDAPCSCDPDCEVCDCDKTLACAPGCPCDADCAVCACDLSSGCEPGCACDPDCCPCDVTLACDGGCPCDLDCAGTEGAAGS